MRREPVLDLLARRGFVDLNSGNVRTFVPRPHPFDRIFVPAQEPEFETTRNFFVVGTLGVDDDGFETGWSDHRMVVTRLRVGADDD